MTNDGVIWDRTRTDGPTSLGTANWGSYTLIGSLQHGYPAPPSNPYTNTCSLGSETKTTSDFIHKNYRGRVSNGEIINSPFKTTKVREELTAPGAFTHIFYLPNGLNCALHTPSQLHDKYWKTTGVWRRGVPSYLDISSSSRSSLRDSVAGLAITNANANIDTSEMLALATVAESGKSIASMQAILWRVYKIVRNVRRLNFRALANELTPKELADRYMEARYAIRPLIYDARGIVNSIKANRGYERRTFRGYAEDSISSQDTVLNASNGLWMTQTDWTRTATYSVSARAGVLCDVSITDISIFGADQLLETCWELVPFSFIVDWFANVGDWIAAQTPNAGVQQRASWVTVRETYTQTRTATADRSIVDTVGYQKGSLSISAQTDTREELVLERFTGVAANTFPSLNMRLDVFKLTDLGIILRKLF